VGPERKPVLLSEVFTAVPEACGALLAGGRWGGESRASDQEIAGQAVRDFFAEAMPHAAYQEDAGRARLLLAARAVWDDDHHLLDPHRARNGGWVG
jgi:hypothetical protein